MFKHLFPCTHINTSIVHTGIPKQRDEGRSKSSNLTHFFQEIDSNISLPENNNKTKDKENKVDLTKSSAGDKHEQSIDTSIVHTGIPKQRDEGRSKSSNLTHFFQEIDSNISLPENNNKTKDKENKVDLTKSSAGDKHEQRLNKTDGTSKTLIAKHKTNPSNTSHDQKGQRVAIQKLLCDLLNKTKGNQTCKDRNFSKKAMIWPTKMLPWLKNVLMSKLQRGSNNHMSFLDNMEDPTGSPFGSNSVNSISDNWDENPFLVHRKHRHGLKMIPLLKNLKATLFGQAPTSNVGSLNDALNSETLNGFGPIPTQGSSPLVHQILKQALGSSDRNSVLNEMRQELLLASDRGEGETNEVFDDVNGRNNLAQLNAGVQGDPVMSPPTQGVAPFAGMNMFQSNTRTPMMEQNVRQEPLMEQPIHAQMLDNGVIAPMGRQPLAGSSLKDASFLSNSPIGGSSLFRRPFRTSSLAASSLIAPTSRRSPLQSSFLETVSREGSLLEKAGGFDLPATPSMLGRTSAPKERMFADSVQEMPDFASRQENFIERNEPLERHQNPSPRPLPRLLGNNLVMEEISDSMARGRNLPVQANPDLERLMKLRSRLRSRNPTSSRMSGLELGSNYGNTLRLSPSSNSLGIASVVAKDEDSINFNDLNSERSLAFRRGKVSKITGNSRAYTKNKSSQQNHKKDNTKTKKS